MFSIETGSYNPEVSKFPSKEKAGKVEEKELELEVQINSLLVDECQNVSGVLQGVLSNIEQGKINLEDVVGILSKDIGPIFTKEVLSNPEYRKDLFELEDFLRGSLSEMVPMADIVNLPSLILVKETFGSVESLKNIVKTFDIKERINKINSQIELKTPADEFQIEVSLISISRFEDRKENIEGQIEIGFTYTDQFNASYMLRRLFKLTEAKQENNVKIKEKTVEHALFELPENFRSNGLGKDVLRDSLVEYKKMGIDKINLHANIKVGGYAWAVYGFGWNKKETVIATLSEYKDFFKDILPIVEYWDDFTEEEKTVIIEENQGIIFDKFVPLFMQNSRIKLEDMIKETGLENGEDILQSFDALLHIPNLSPQDIALFAEDAPKVYRNRVSSNGDRTWYTEDQLREAEVSGTISQSQIATIRKNPFHPGKVAMFGTNWHGTIELNDAGEQKGENLQLLEEYLAGKNK